ncbi:MAG: DUF4178 domain-containing protein, partial [Blastocatellia bacterium]|nr:DUF4178 domain-containing protein [Blastocatellia bacterium]
MTIKQGNCPSCGGEVHFKIGSSFIVVCQYCNSLVARNDQKLEDLGKVAEVIETESLIKIGFLGRYKGVGFQVTGRTQLKHQMGGFWTEWYAAFDDGRWGWISEAQGKLYILFAEAVSELPNYFSLNVGQVADLKLPVKFTVAEKGIATYSAAQGEIPFRFTPGERYNYVDLAGNSGEFATLDYGEQSPLIFLGQEIRPIDLGIETFETIPDQEAAKKVSTTNIPC